MVEAMLTMGGSDKREGSVGGFGNAKLIVIFAHKNFQIHSLNTLAKGEVLSYELFDAEFFNGTKISCEFAADFNYEKEEMVRH